MGLLTKIFGDPNEKEIKKLGRLVDQVNNLADEMKGLKEADFPVKTASFKERLSRGESLDDLLPEAFALAREAAERTTGMRPFDVQVLGGIVLHQGRAAEMKTGEGKTLVATMPAYLNALTGRGVHIVTVNDYLARRDSEWMGPVYRLLGLKVGLIVHGLDAAQRQEAYAADIIYATNNELGFDYLRDNMVLRKEKMVQRPRHYAIVDEVDSILIDEARTPLIISSRVESKESELYAKWNKPVTELVQKQRKIVADILQEAVEALDEENRDKAAELLYLAQRGMPKNKKLLKLLEEPGLRRLLEQIKQQLSHKEKQEMGEQLFFTIDEASGAATLSSKGEELVSRQDPVLLKYLGYEDSREKDDDLDEEIQLSEEEQDRAIDAKKCFEQLIKAHTLFENEVNYIVENDQVVIVDEFTGRLMRGRRYSDGLHQAIEAKEGVKIQDKSRTVASITFQNFFRPAPPSTKEEPVNEEKYKKLAGMTGTAATEEDEFRNIYGMDVVIIPTNKPMIRQDLPDVIYRTEQAKFNAIVEEIYQRHVKGQPILVGTISVEKSEVLSKMLQRRGVTHRVLNAKYHAKEAEIVAQAGKKSAVTIATNMAGRGTDIVLGGNIEPDLKAIQDNPDLSPPEKEQQMKKLKDRWQQEHNEVVELGGLHILGTERHESRRIDNQLRGRAGRQGDPGSSQFFVSLEDDLMRLFGAGNIGPLMEKLGMDDQMTIDHPMISRAIENAQQKVESRNFDIRKHTLEYDDVLNQQREVIYRQRKQVLEGERLKDRILEMMEEVIEGALDLYANPKIYEDEWDLEGLLHYGERIFLPGGKYTLEDFRGKDREDLYSLLLEAAKEFYQSREDDLGPEIMPELERVILLRVVDAKWADFIDEMHDLRQGIGFRVYGQRDPLQQYRLEAAEMFQGMIRSIQEDVVRLVLHVKVNAAPERRSVHTGVMQASHAGSAAGGGETGPAKKQPVTVQKVGRNAPCPCGSGKKHKKCCGS